MHSVVAAIKPAKLLACAIRGACSQALFEVFFRLHKTSSHRAVQKQTTEIEPLRISTREPLAHPATAEVAANTPWGSCSWKNTWGKKERGLIHNRTKKQINRRAWNARVRHVLKKVGRRRISRHRFHLVPEVKCLKVTTWSTVERLKEPVHCLAEFVLLPTRESNALSARRVR